MLYQKEYRQSTESQQWTKSSLQDYLKNSNEFLEWNPVLDLEMTLVIALLTLLFIDYEKLSKYINLIKIKRNPMAILPTISMKF